MWSTKLDRLPSNRSSKSRPPRSRHRRAMVGSMMDGASPATSTSTVRNNNKGGRPREWTDSRARKLHRFYLYTPLPLPQILQLMKDGLWNPGFVANGSPCT
jgi:hypothetical protein